MKKKEIVMETLEATLKPEQKIKLQQKEVSERTKQYRDLKLDYLRDKAALKDQAKKDLEERKQQYIADKLSIEQPLKAEKYRLKIQKKNRNRSLNEAPRRGILEEVGNATTHGVGAILGLVCLGLMIAKANDAWSLTAAMIYGSCFFLQMLFSCLYHSFRCGTTVKRIFRRFDYSSIYLAIGGTFAPLWLIYMRTKMWGDVASIAFISVQWALIALGITFVAVFGPGRVRWLHFTLYFVIGWSAILFFPYWIRGDIPLLIWEIIGGSVYTLGMIPFALLKKKPVAHFIWHFFVLAGAILMWTGLYLYVF